MAAVPLPRLVRMPASQDELSTIREQVLYRHLEAERSADPDAILATFTHPRYELVGNGRVYDGADEVRGYLVERAKVFPDLHTDVIHLWHSPEVVAAELWLNGSHQSGIADVAAAPGASSGCARRASSCSPARAWSASARTSTPARSPANWPEVVVPLAWRRCRLRAGEHLRVRRRSKTSPKLSGPRTARTRRLWKAIGRLGAAGPPTVKAPRGRSSQVP